MKISVYSDRKAKIILIFAWVLAGLNTLLAVGVIYIMGVFYPQFWLVAIPWVALFIIALFWPLIGGIGLIIGGIAGLIWLGVDIISGYLATIAFTVALISGILLIAAWLLEKKSSK
jgi:hypothetical protein